MNAIRKPTDVDEVGHGRCDALVCCAERGRLVYYGEPATSHYWSAHWAKQFSSKMYEPFAKGDLGQYERTFLKYLPKEGRILEAGCGLGQIVVALRARGYNCEGVDWADETIRAAKALWPLLPVRAGDVTHLGVPDGHYRAYISLGVVEHRLQGPEPFMVEANRVLAEGGVALVAVPWVNWVRRARVLAGGHRQKQHGLSFYQYAFSEQEMRCILRRAGFRVVDTLRYGAWYHVETELPWLRSLFRLRGLGWRLDLWLRSSWWANRIAGNMLLFVCRKAAAC